MHSSDHRRDRAISTVIGAVVLVAVTVLLAAVVGVFVVGIGGPSDVPAGSFDLSVDTGDDGTLAGAGDGGTCAGDTYADDDSITLTYEVGDDVQRSNLGVVVGSTRATEAPCAASGSVTNLDTISTTPSELSAGRKIVVAEGAGNNAIRSGETVKLVWESSDGGESHVIAEETIP